MTAEKTKKGKFLNDVANANGVAVVVLDARSNEIAAVNNNSICRALWNSEKFSPACARDCGAVFAKTSNGKPFDYECHAGLQCRALPVEDRGTRFVAIVGRTFQKSENYRKATEKAINGEWSSFKPTEFFANVLMSGSNAGIERAAKSLGKFTVSEPDDLLELKPKIAKLKPKPAPPTDELSEMVRRFNETTPASTEVAIAERRSSDSADIRSLVGSIMRLEYREACAAALDLLRDKYEFSSLIWLERRGDLLSPFVTRGELQGKPVRINLRADNERLVEAADLDRPLILRERGEHATRSLSLFPSKVGSEIRSAIAVEAEIADQKTADQILRVSKAVSPQIEMLRLRSVVSERDKLARGMKRFNDSLQRVDADDFWLRVTQASAELLGAERASLLVFDETKNRFKTKAAFGSAIDLYTNENVGERISRQVIERGLPITPADLPKLGVESAPLDWKYRSASFISFPVALGDRRIGVINLTDRADKVNFGSDEIELLQSITPQIAVALDRTRFKSKAIEFEQRSITDALTGLRNRGYLEERLTEEISQARRYRSSMCLLMIDVDNFKSYNDSFGHTAGDTVLKLIADVFHATLRAADVAARYGGEEFAILLPHTSVEEATVIAERIRQRVEHTEFPLRRLTISLGLAGYATEFEEPKDWVTAADMALYDVKEHGRNGIQTYERLGRSFREKIN
ncbi:MAG: diguanylate cyclase [Pyrinomonadaceae bacterium]